MVTYFTKDWTIKKKLTVPVFIPIQKFPITKTSKSYQNFCRCLLLCEKPGCYISNVGTNFENFEEELRDFVLNSKFCPMLAREDFEKSQLEIQDDLNPDGSKDEQLLISPLQKPGDEDRVPTSMQIHLPP